LSGSAGRASLWRPCRLSLGTGRQRPERGARRQCSRESLWRPTLGETKRFPTWPRQPPSGRFRRKSMARRGGRVVGSSSTSSSTSTLSWKWKWKRDGHFTLLAPADQQSQSASERARASGRARVREAHGRTDRANNTIVSHCCRCPCCCCIAVLFDGIWASSLTLMILAPVCSQYLALALGRPPIRPARPSDEGAPNSGAAGRMWSNNLAGARARSLALGHRRESSGLPFGRLEAASGRIPRGIIGPSREPFGKTRGRKRDWRPSFTDGNV